MNIEYWGYFVKDRLINLKKGLRWFTYLLTTKILSAIILKNKKMKLMFKHLAQTKQTAIQMFLWLAIVTIIVIVCIVLIPPTIPVTTFVLTSSILLPVATLFVKKSADASHIHSEYQCKKKVKLSN